MPSISSYKRRLLALMWVSVALCASRLSAQELIAKSITGQHIEGTLSAWNTQGVTLLQAGATTTIASSDLLNVKLATASDSAVIPADYLQLGDGTRIPVTSFQVSAGTATVSTPLASEPLSIPTARIRLVEFAIPVSLDWRADLESNNSSSDLLAVFKKETSAIDFLAGVVNDITDSEVSFTWEGETLAVKRTKLAGIAYYHAQQEELPEPTCWIRLLGEIKIPVARIEHAGDHLEVFTTAGMELNLPLDKFLEADFSLGKLSQLSDMTPLKQRWTPLIAIPSPSKKAASFGLPRRDVSYAGLPLTLFWPNASDPTQGTLQTYEKGLALRSRTELEYRIPKSMRRFTAIAGIDPETLAQGTAALTIETDGEVVFEQMIDGSQPPVEIALEVAGKQSLKIFVDYGENLDLGDRLHLVEAQFTK